MSSKHISVTRDRGPLLEYAFRVIERAYRNYRDLGFKAEFAFEEVALDFDLPPSRVKALRYRDKIWSILVDEVERLDARQTRHMDHVEALTEERREALRIRRQQMTLVLECSNGSEPGLPSRAGGTGNGETSAKAEAARAEYLRLRAEIALDQRRRK